MLGSRALGRVDQELVHSVCVCVCCEHTVCVYLYVCMHTCGLAHLCRTQCEVCVCLHVTVLPTGNSWLCFFEVRLLLSDKQREKQVLELADSSVQHVLFAFITVLNHQTKRKTLYLIKYK